MYEDIHRVFRWDEKYLKFQKKKLALKVRSKLQLYGEHTNISINIYVLTPTRFPKNTL